MLPSSVLLFSWKLCEYLHCASPKSNNLAPYCLINIDLIQKKNLSVLLFLLSWQV